MLMGSNRRESMAAMRLAFLWVRMIFDYVVCLVGVAGALTTFRQKSTGGVGETIAVFAIFLLVAAAAYKDAGRAKSKLWPPTSNEIT
jgi:hypothetical protein